MAKKPCLILGLRAARWLEQRRQLLAGSVWGVATAVVAVAATVKADGSFRRVGMATRRTARVVAVVATKSSITSIVVKASRLLAASLVGPHGSEGTVHRARMYV